MFSREKQRKLVIDPLESHKPLFLIDYDLKDIDKDYNRKLGELSKGDTVEISKKYYPWSKHNPDYEILFDK